MHINSPKRSTNGTTQVNVPVQVSVGTINYGSLSAAEAAKYIMTNSTSVIGGKTVRSSMQKGVTAFKTYRDTTYGAEYSNYRSEGRLITFYNLGGNFQVQNSVIGLGYTGFFNSGFNEYLGDINSQGGSGNLEAVFNRALLLNMRNQSITECLEKAISMKLDMSEAMGGLKPTVVMIAESASRVLRAWQAIRKGDIRGAFYALHLSPQHLKQFRLKTASEMWLQLQYGWMPLLMDIFNGINYVADAVNPVKSPPTQFTCVRRLEQRLVVKQPSHPNPSVWPGFATKGEAMGAVETRYRFRISDPNVYLFNNLGLINPLYTVWVSLPFTFLLDWLLPVSTFLKAITAPLGLQFVSGYSTTKSWGTTQVTVTAKVFPPQAAYRNEGECTAYCEKGFISRVRYTNWPGPALFFRFPFSSEKRVANAVALLHTGINRR